MQGGDGRKGGVGGRTHGRSCLAGSQCQELSRAPAGRQAVLPGPTVHTQPAYSMTDSLASMEQPAGKKPNLIASMALQTVNAQPQHA